MLSETVGEWTKKWREGGREEGRNLNRLDNARKMLAEGLDDELVARITELSMAEIEKLKHEH